MTPLRVGTRGSRLALRQAGHVVSLLQPLVAPRSCAIVEIQTAGDRVRDAPLPQLGGEGVFTKEIQRALLDGEVDVAVHSLKDLPTLPVEGLELAAVPPRGPAGDVLISLRHRGFDSLPTGAVVATSSPRRRAQALYRRPDLRVVDMRGNVETRLRKLAELDLDALILAEAGLERLDRGDAITERLDPAWMLPAVGQGALGLECRTGDEVTRRFLSLVDDYPTRQAVGLERTLLRSLGGGCRVPIGAATAVAEQIISCHAAVLQEDGKRRVEGWVNGPLAEAESLGRHLAEQLLNRGAGELLDRSQNG